MAKAAVGAELEALGVDLEFGAELDLVTKADLQRELKNLRHDLSAPYRERVMYANGAVSPAAGPWNVRVADIPDGKTFILTKYMVWSNAQNPGSGSIYTAAGSWGGLFHGNQPSPAQLADFWPFPEASTFQVLPYTKEFGFDTGPEWRQNDNIFAQIVVPPPSVNITVICFGWLLDLQQRRKK